MIGLITLNHSGIERAVLFVSISIMYISVHRKMPRNENGDIAQLGKYLTHPKLCPRKECRFLWKKTQTNQTKPNQTITSLPPPKNNPCITFVSVFMLNYGKNFQIYTELYVLYFLLRYLYIYIARLYTDH